MDLETITQKCKSEREKQLFYMNVYMWNLDQKKKGTDEIICKSEIETQT